MTEIDIFEDRGQEPCYQDVPHTIAAADHQSFLVFKNKFLKKPGEHLIGVGRSGSGKTHKGLWLVDKLKEFDTILWFDTGKSFDFGSSQEIAPLFGMGLPVNVILPAGCFLYIEGSPVPVEFTWIMRSGDLWDRIKPGFINIACFERFFIEPDLYAKYTAAAFRELYIISIREMDRIKAVLPLAIIHDELPDIAPGQTHALSKSHLHSAKVMGYNINKLRSAGVRICGYTQKWVMVYPNVRSAFQWILCCHGSYFEREEPDLRAYNRFYKKLGINQAILWRPDRSFQDIWKFEKFESPAGITMRPDGLITAM